MSAFVLWQKIGGILCRPDKQSQSQAADIVAIPLSMHPERTHAVVGVPKTIISAGFVVKPKAISYRHMHHSQSRHAVCCVPRTTSVPALSTKSMALWWGFSLQRCRMSSKLSMAQGRSTRLTLVFSKPPCTEEAGPHGKGKRQVSSQRRAEPKARPKMTFQQAHARQ